MTSSITFCIFRDDKVYLNEELIMAIWLTEIYFPLLQCSLDCLEFCEVIMINALFIEQQVNYSNIEQFPIEILLLIKKKNYFEIDKFSESGGRYLWGRRRVCLG